MFVDLVVGGTATLWRDYWLGATDAGGAVYPLSDNLRVLMLPSVEQSTLVVVPLSDAADEGDETVTIEIGQVGVVPVSAGAATWSGEAVALTISNRDGDGDDGDDGDGDGDDGGDGDRDDGGREDDDDGGDDGGGEGDDDDGGDGGDPAPPESDECGLRVAPYWRGTGGFAVRPSDGRSAAVRFECGGASFSSQEYAGEDGLIVRNVSAPACIADDGRPIRGELTFEGIDEDGWYWLNGNLNVALSPLVCESSLSPRLRPPVPAGVTASPGGDRLFVLSATGRHYGTLMSHDGNGFIGLVPHLVDMEGNGEHVAPYWIGHGGVVGRPLDGNAATFRLTCEDGRTKSYNLEADEDGIIVSLLSGCFDSYGKPTRGELQADGLEDGAWYWVNSGRRTAAAAFLRRDSDPATLTVPVIPGGVDSDSGARGTFLSHGSLIGIVPRVAATDE